MILIGSRSQSSTSLAALPGAFFGSGGHHGGGGGGQPGFQSESNKQVAGDVVMFSGCADNQTSADVANAAQATAPIGRLSVHGGLVAPPLGGCLWATWGTCAGKTVVCVVAFLPIRKSPHLSTRFLFRSRRPRGRGVGRGVWESTSPGRGVSGWRPGYGKFFLGNAHLWAVPPPPRGPCWLGGWGNPPPRVLKKARSPTFWH